MDNDKNNKKSKSGRKPKSTSTTPEPKNNSSENISPKFIEMDLTHLLQNFLVDSNFQEEIIKNATKELDSENAIAMVKNILSEYFTSFMLLGYDINGDRKVIKLAKTDRDEDSIIELLRYVMIRIIGGEP